MCSIRVLDSNDLENPGAYCINSEYTPNFPPPDPDQYACDEDNPYFQAGFPFCPAESPLVEETLAVTFSSSQNGVSLTVDGAVVSTKISANASLSVVCSDDSGDLCGVTLNSMTFTPKQSLILMGLIGVQKMTVLKSVPGSFNLASQELKLNTDSLLLGVWWSFLGTHHFHTVEAECDSFTGLIDLDGQPNIVDLSAHCSAGTSVAGILNLAGYKGTVTD